MEQDRHRTRADVRPSGVSRPNWLARDPARLEGVAAPSVRLKATSGRFLDLYSYGGRSAVFFYPRNSRPGIRTPRGWDLYAGARGCTTEALGFKQVVKLFEALDVRVLAVSSQSTAYQREFVERLALPFEILSDWELQLTRALCLPTFELDGEVFIERLSLLLNDGSIEKVFYPVPNPSNHARDVLAWLSNHASPTSGPRNHP